MNESLENMTEPSESLADVYTRWSSDTHIARIPTGFPTLDDACRGGLPVPWRIVVVGAPSAGKTALVMVVVRQFAQSGVVCGVLGVDEESDKLAVRAAQMLGFSVEQCEQRDAAALRDMVVAATGVDMRFYPPSTSIEAAAADVAARAADLGKHGVLAIDSIQTARCQRSLKEPALGAREIVEANMRAMTLVSREYRLLTVATSEANRGSYRTDDSAQVGDEIAAGKESGAIEYAAQTLLVLRTPRKHPD